MDSVPQKKCSKCGEYYPPSLEYFKSEKRNKSGLTAQCINCIQAYQRERYYEPDVYARAQARRADTEYKAKHKEYCKTEDQLNKARIRGQRPETKARLLAYSRTPKRIAYVKHYKQQPKYKHYTISYYQQHDAKERNRTKEQRRRARKRKLPDTFTVEQWANALNYFDNKCAVCGKPIGLWHTLAQDHWIPLISPNCPGTIATNIIPLCHGDGGCNNSKSKLPPDEWLIKRFGKRKAKDILARVQAYFEWVKAV